MSTTSAITRIPYVSVYDAGGQDTFDFSTANRGVFIDLRPAHSVRPPKAK